MARNTRSTQYYTEEEKFNARIPGATRADGARISPSGQIISAGDRARIDRQRAAQGAQQAGQFAAPVAPSSQPGTASRPALRPGTAVSGVDFMPGGSAKFAAQMKDQSAVRDSVESRINAGAYDFSKLQHAGTPRSQGGLTSLERAMGNKVGAEADTALAASGMPTGTGISELSGGQFMAFGRDGKSQKFSTREEATTWLNSPTTPTPQTVTPQTTNTGTASATTDDTPPSPSSSEPQPNTAQAPERIAASTYVPPRFDAPPAPLGGDYRIRAGDQGATIQAATPATETPISSDNSLEAKKRRFQQTNASVGKLLSSAGRRISDWLGDTGRRRDS
ncbi:hypothetical protein Ga0100231_005170 [Opitutaceae bacterium TAV4]|nr:hypothetical protein Ga0100231_005170 [Opitutaceae bacterium TAV4]RRK02382.1 hypothetical protein Ga0100230_004300 [Opitutaceae bacterium TAV3]